MENKEKEIIISQKGFTVVGIAIVTTNKEAFKDNTISNLWAKFIKEDYQNRIPNKVDNTIYAVYYDYQNDRNGKYTLLLGCKVNKIENLPFGLVFVNVPTYTYKVYDSKDYSNERILELWKLVWKEEDSTELKRKYFVDFEDYSNGIDKPKIYISV